jgi:glycosyltransferase involved in cell wall biosynthesis
MAKPPLVSLIMPAFGMERLLAESIKSVLDQTYDNIELIGAVERGTSEDRRIFEAFASTDSRVRAVENVNSKGYIGLLNTALADIKGTLVGRADADDICLPNRIAQQVSLFETRPDISVCGSWVETFGRVDGVKWKLPVTDADIRARMLFCGAIANPTVMWRRSLFDGTDPIYDYNFSVAEDYELLTRLPREAILANVPKILLRYRTHTSNLGTTQSQRAAEFTSQIHRRQLAKIGISPTAEQLRLHARIGASDDFESESELQAVDDWLNTIRSANDAQRYFDVQALSAYLDSTKSEMLRRREERRSVKPRAKLQRLRRSLLYAAPPWLRPAMARGYGVGQIGLRVARQAASRGKASVGIGERSKIALARSIPASPKIGMAILAHERPDYLEQCLDSLFATNLRGYDVTFLLIDDGSRDPRVREILEKKRGEAYRIVRIYAPKGPNCAGAAINRAMKELLRLQEFDIVGWTDPDALYHPDWLDHLMRVAIWAKANHKLHNLGPFSSFNSSDRAFHGVLGTYGSPEGSYVVKRQMGMLNYFYFKPDFDALGYFDENPDDETLMTKKFAALKVRNFCTETSYVEHLGQESVLNAWRPVPVARAVSGLHLAPAGWPDALEAADTLGYYRDVKVPKSLSADGSKDSKLDVVIPAIAKDVETLALSVQGLRENLSHSISNVFIVGPADDGRVRAVAKDLHCQFVDEREFLPFGKERIPYVVNGRDRSGWLYQQLLKLSANKIASGSEYLLMDADTILMKKQSFIVEGKHVLLHSDEFHKPYFDVCGDLLASPPHTLLSCVSHNMLVSLPRLARLKDHLEQRFARPWYMAILDCVDYSEASGFSEYELYGQWCISRYPSSTTREYCFNLAIPPISHNYRFLKRTYGARYRSVSLHSYLGKSKLVARLRSLSQSMSS